VVASLPGPRGRQGGDRATAGGQHDGGGACWFSNTRPVSLIHEWDGRGEETV